MCCKCSAGKLFAALLISILILSCEKEATVKLPDTKPKPVLVCFISPEDPYIRVRLTNSIPLYNSAAGNYPYEIKDAEVVISNGSTSTTIPWYKDSVGYLISTNQFVVKPGETYEINVKIPDGRMLSATTQVPAEAFPMLDFSLEKKMLDSSEFGVNYEITYTLKWKDIVGVKNYYRGLIYNLYHDSLTTADTTLQLLNELFETDEGRDGKDLQLIGNGFLSFTQGGTPPMFGSNDYIAYLMSANKAYYLYHKDLYNDQGDSPFSEAKINYSNIEGGIGCFGAYRLAKKRF